MSRIHSGPNTFPALGRSDADTLSQEPGGGATVFDIPVELIANDGAEKTGPVQCTDNNDAVIHWDSSFPANTYRFTPTGTTLYRFPMDQGVGGSGPDQDDEGVRVNTNLTNASAAENLTRGAFTIILRGWLAVSGAADRKLFQMWINGPSIVYRSGGDDNMTFTVPGSTPATKIIGSIPEGQMITILMRYDGTTAFFEVLDEDGTTSLGSDSGLASGLTDSGDTVSFQAGTAFFMKRAATINGFVDGADLDVLLAAVLTNDPLPVT